MRTTPSRFSSFAATVDPNLEGRPSVMNTPAASTAASTTRSVLEQRYPAVVRTLTLLWGYPELNQYFEKISTGADPTLSLEPPALAELMLLAAIHQRICPYRPAKPVEEVYAVGRRIGPWRPARQRLG
jgi:hypothetical protein